MRKSPTDFLVSEGEVSEGSHEQERLTVVELAGERLFAIADEVIQRPVLLRELRATRKGGDDFSASYWKGGGHITSATKSQARAGVSSDGRGCFAALQRTMTEDF